MMMSVDVVSDCKRNISLSRGPRPFRHVTPWNITPITTMHLKLDSKIRHKTLLEFVMTFRGA